MQIKMLLSIVAVSVFGISASDFRHDNAPNDQRLQWWREARFGMFVHWGPISLRGTEIGWSRGDQVPADEYDNLYRRFNPTNFDARAWARLAKDSGMKYLVLTSKHHDGFCLWNTKVTDYNVVNAPFGRDVVKELAEACRAEGIVFCTYHSICDWRHPDYPLGSPGGKSKKSQPNMDRYNSYLKKQVAELIQNYGPLGVMWFDGEWEEPWTPDRGRDLYEYCRALQPSIIVNNRVSKARRGMEGSSTPGEFPGDFDTPEQRIGNYQTNRPWESCITICQQWSWKPDDKLKSFEQCAQTLVRTAGGDGNLLLNVGPLPNGEIEPRQAQCLRQIGHWLRANGESIYGTRAGPIPPAEWGATTRKGNTIYVHVLNWRGSTDLTLPRFPQRIVGGKLLHGGNVEVKETEAGTTIQVSRVDQKQPDTVVALAIKEGR